MEFGLFQSFVLFVIRVPFPPDLCQAVVATPKKTGQRYYMPIPYSN